MNENPTCRASIRAELKAFADGELAPLARLRVARHLRTCPACREELIQMQTLSTELQESEGEATPLAPELRAHILDSVPPQEHLEDAATEKRRRRIARKKMVLAVGVCSLTGLFVLTTLHRSVPMKSTFERVADVSSSPPIGGHDSGVIVGGASSASKANEANSVLRSYSQAGSAPGTAYDSTTTNGTTTMTFADGSAPLVTPTDQFAQEKAAVQAERRNLPVPPTSTQFSVKLNNPTSDSVTIDANPILPPTRVVHREGSLSVAVSDTEKASDDTTNIIKNAGGFVANNSLETGANQKRTASLDCRVPVAQFETVVRKIGALGKVRAKSLSGQDITAQVARLGARRQTLTQELAVAQARLNEREKSRKKTDTSELRAEVRTSRIQAAQARAQLEALQKYGSLSSLYVTLQDTTPVATPKAAGWFDSLSPSSQAAWNTFLTTARLPLQIVLWILAYSPLWLPLLLVWRKFGRKWLFD